MCDCRAFLEWRFVEEPASIVGFRTGKKTAQWLVWAPPRRQKVKKNKFFGFGRLQKRWRLTKFRARVWKKKL